MIICWHCETRLLDGTIFCDSCGAALLEDASHCPVPPLPSADNTVILPSGEPPQPPAPLPGAGRPFMPRLILTESGMVITLPPAQSLVVGRLGDRGPAPDVDLAPFRAADAGVSRSHATLDLAGPRPLIKDLGSTNGTYINGSRLAPYTPAPIYAGDLINLGRLSVRLEL